MTRGVRYTRARAATLATWSLLLLTLGTWHLAAPAAVAVGLAVLTILPLLAALPGLWRGRRRTYRWASLTLAPAMAWSLTEIVANPADRLIAMAAATLAFAALAALVATLRTMPPAG